MTSNAENEGGQRWSRGRIAAWGAAALLLLLPLVAMQFTKEVNWSASDFALASVLLFVPLGVYELVVRKTGNPAYRAGVGVALAATFLLVWSNAAVGLTDSAADGMYLVVIAVGIGGAFVAGFRPAGMARVTFAVALGLTLVSVGALIAGIVPAHNPSFQVLGITEFFVALFAGSALLFRAAARRTTEQEAA